MDSKKGIIGFTAGNFDLLHPGYIYTFEAAKEHCDYFIVFLQRDPSETPPLKEDSSMSQSVALGLSQKRLHRNRPS